MSENRDNLLLKKAAKAAGIQNILCYEAARNCLRIGNRKRHTLWRPLTDDGDAFRLALRLKINIHHWVSANQKGPHRVSLGYCLCEDTSMSTVYTLDGNDPDAALRRAIVETAARMEGRVWTANC
jgi:hypothetical protein